MKQNFLIDRLTDSIINTISGDSFKTEVSIFTQADLNQITKEDDWNFNWADEFKDFGKEIYKLTILGNPFIIQGLVV